MSEDQPSNTGSIVLTVVVISLILFGVIFYIYRRKLHQELKQALGTQVSEQVNSYIAFYENNKKSKSSIDNE